MMHFWNEQQTIDLLKNLVNTASPSGYTTSIMKEISRFLDENGIPYKKTNKGAIIATFEGDNNNQHRLLTAHTDTLGAIVKEVKSSGRLKLNKIGGFNWNAAEGEYCTIHTADGRKIRGTILMHETTVHVYAGASELKRDDNHIEVRIDEKVFSAQDTRALGIEV